MQSDVNDDGTESAPSDSGAAADGGERAAAICEHCGTCHVVRVRPEGSVRVIGTDGHCKCGEDDYRILGAAR